MGLRIFDWFNKEKKQSIRYNEVERWCAKRQEEISQQAERKLLSLIKQIETVILETKNNIKILSRAELLNKNISERERQIMEGNRKTYIQRVSNFLERIDSSKPASMGDASVFLENYERELAILAKGLERPYYMLSHFFHNEADRVGSGLSRIDRIVGQLRDLRQKTQEDSAPLQEIIDMFETYDNNTIRLREIKKEERLLKSELQKQEGESKSSEAEKSKLEHSTRLKELKRRLENNKTDLKGINDKLTDDFSVLNKAFRKYARISTEETIINAYLENPIDALMNDSELNIISVLEKTKKAIESKVIDVQDRVKDKMIKKIDFLSGEYVGKTREKRNTLIQSIEMLSAQIAEDPATVKLELIINRLEESNKEIEKISNRLLEIERDIQKTEPDKIKLNIMEVAEKKLGIKIID